MPEKIILIPFDIDDVLIINESGKLRFNDELIKKIADFIKKNIILENDSTYKIIIKSGSKRFGIGVDSMNLRAGLSPLILEVFKQSLFENLKEEKIKIEADYFQFGSLFERDLGVFSPRTLLGFADDLKSTDKLKFSEKLGNKNHNLFFLEMAIKYFIDNQCLSDEETKKLKQLTQEEKIELSKRLDGKDEINECEKENKIGKIPDGNIAAILFSYKNLYKVSCAKLMSCLYGLYSLNLDSDTEIFLLMGDDEKKTIDTYVEILSENPQLLPCNVAAHIFHLNCENNYNLSSEMKVTGTSNKNLAEIKEFFNNAFQNYVNNLPLMKQNENSRIHSQKRTEYIKKIQTHETFSIEELANILNEKIRMDENYKSVRSRYNLFCCFPRNNKNDDKKTIKLEI